MKSSNFPLFLFAIIITFSPHYLLSQLSNKFGNSLHTVVLLEKKIDTFFIPHGTGFIVESGDKNYPSAIITNEHLLRNPNIYITISADQNLIDKMAEIVKTQHIVGRRPTITINGNIWTFYDNKLRYNFKLIPDSTFVYDKSNDIAAFKLSIGNYLIQPDSTKFQVSNIICFDSSYYLSRESVPIGTDVYFIGFPYAIGTELGYSPGYVTNMFSESIPSPVVRKGILAWASSNNNFFLIDAFSYSGNSGSPVIAFNKSQTKPYLIGIVVGHLPSDSSDNMGLAKCIWFDEVFKLLDKLKNL
jgi:hypothetical protein